MTGVSKPMLGQIVRGQSIPTIMTLWKIATGLKVPLSSLLENAQTDYQLSDTKDKVPINEENGKGSTWHFGYKAHIGVDEESGLVHTVKATPANAHDVTAVHELLNGEERVYGDSGYIGTKKRPEAIRKNKNGKNIKYIINRRPSSIKKLSKSGQYAAKKREHQKSSVRCKIEHVFAVVKNIFQYRKTRYRRSAKTDCQTEYHVRIGKSVFG